MIEGKENTGLNFSKLIAISGIITMTVGLVLINHAYTVEVMNGGLQYLGVGFIVGMLGWYIDNRKEIKMSHKNKKSVVG